MTATYGEPLVTSPGLGARRRPGPRSPAPTATQRLAHGQPVTQRPGVHGPGGLLALQRTAGNKAAAQLLSAKEGSARSSVQRELTLTPDQQKLANAKNLPSGPRWVPAGTRSSRLRDGLSTGATAAGVPAATLAGFGAAVITDDPYAKDAKTLAEVGNQDQRDALKAAAAPAGVVTDILALGSNGAALFILAKKLKEETGWAKGRTALELTAQGTGAVAKTGKSLAGASKAGTQIAATSGASSAKAAVTGSAGFSEAFSAIGAAFDALISGGKGLWGIIRVVQGKAKNKKTQLLESVTQLFESGKSFLSMINGTISSVRWFLKLAETAGDFVQAVPFVGGAIAIFTQAIDILVQGLKAIRQVVTAAGAWLQKQKMAGFLAALPRGKRKDREMLTHLGEINGKRVNRAMIPLTAAGMTAVGDVISIGGSVLNIVGSATAGAMGAGGALLAAGYGTAALSGVVKVGAASLRPGAYVVRTGKQKFRDVAASNSVAKGLNTELFGKRVFNTDKTTDQKNKRLSRSSNTLIRRIKEIPDQAALAQMNPVQQEKHANRIREVMAMLEATGVDVAKLAGAQNIDEMTGRLQAALKGRG